MVDNNNPINSEIMVVTSEINTDIPLKDAKQFKFGAYAETISEIILNQKNETPFSFLINGKWGSGKTTLMNTIRNKLEDPLFSKKIADELPKGKNIRKVKCVWFDAWKYSETDSMLAALVSEIFKEMGKDGKIKSRLYAKLFGGIQIDLLKQMSDLANVLSAGRFEIDKWFKDPDYKKKLSFYDIFQEDMEKIRRVFVLDKKVKKRYLFNWEKIPGKDNKRLIDFLKQNFSIEWIEKAKFNKNDDGKIIRITNGNKFLSLTLNDKKTNVNLQIDDGRTDKLFVMNKYGKLKIYRKDSDKEGALVIFIDDLDRCPPKNVTKVLESINLFLDQSGCFFIFGADISIVSKAINLEYKDLEGFSGREYIKKMIQLQFDLPEILDKDIRTFIESLGAEESLCLFNWDGISGKDDGGLRKYLTKKFNADWLNAAKIEKIDDDRTINVYAKENAKEKYIHLRLNEKKNRVHLKIDDGRTYELIAKTEDDKLNIYSSDIFMIVKGIENNQREIKRFLNNLNLHKILGKKLKLGSTGMGFDNNLLIKWRILNSYSEKFINAVKKQKRLLIDMQEYSRDGKKFEDFINKINPVEEKKREKERKNKKIMEIKNDEKIDENDKNNKIEKINQDILDLDLEIFISKDSEYNKIVKSFMADEKIKYILNCGGEFTENNIEIYISYGDIASETPRLDSFFVLKTTSFFRENNQEEVRKMTGINKKLYDIQAIVDNNDEAKLMNVDRVEYYLHSSYPKDRQIRSFSNYRDKFLLRELAWGEFMLFAKVFEKGKEKPTELQEHITLQEKGPRLI